MLSESFFLSICSVLCESYIFEKKDNNFDSFEKSFNILTENKDYIEKNFLDCKRNGDKAKSPSIGDLLIKQGEYFCRDLWPGLSIRNTFLKNCNITECNNGVNETFPVMTEAETEVLRTSNSIELKKTLAKEFLGYEIPDLGFMLSNSIQWPSEYLKQI